LDYIILIYTDICYSFGYSLYLYKNAEYSGPVLTSVHAI